MYLDMMPFKKACEKLISVYWMAARHWFPWASQSPTLKA
jgi:hypothetical protein